MALSLPSGLTPPEIAFLCEMELVTVVPRQRLEGLTLLGGITPALNPPHHTTLPLWLALLFKRQNRANIVPPSWLSVSSLTSILSLETSLQTFSPPPDLPPRTTISPPFIPSATADADADALPYHWLSLAYLLLEGAADDIPDINGVRRLIRDLREARMAKLRAGTAELDGSREINLNGIGGLEATGGRAFIGGVMDGLRTIGASKELARREKEAEDRENGLGGADDDDDNDDMEL